MAAPYSPPVKGEEFKVKIALRSIADGNFFKTTPQITAGDFKVDTWSPGSPSSVLTNLATLPTVDPPGSVLVLIELSAAEMNGDIVTVVGRQQGSPIEWADFVLSIPTRAIYENANVTHVNEVEITGDGTLGNEWGPV